MGNIFKNSERLPAPPKTQKLSQISILFKSVAPSEI